MDSHRNKGIPHKDTHHNKGALLHIVQEKVESCVEEKESSPDTGST
ncbi:hypothetical protein Hdeb2414_s0005g00172431 [Helianthus debilis subsp. tardiflorus]